MWELLGRRFASATTRPFGTAVRFASGVLREQCSLVAILASQRACMRVVIRGLATVLLELPAHPASASPLQFYILSQAV